MDTKEMLQLAAFVKEHFGMIAVVSVVVICSVFEFTRIKINPWSCLFGWIGKLINGELMAKLDEQKKQIDQLDSKVQKIEDSAEERAAKDARIRILRFGDEILHGVEHSKEHFDQILMDITEYDQYCDDHKDFVNNMTRMTTQKIMETYSKRWDKKDFK